VRSFRVWQKALLNYYLDLFRQNKLDDEEQLLVQRFSFLAKKVKFIIRKSFKRWKIACKGPISKSELIDKERLDAHSRYLAGSLRIINIT